VRSRATFFISSALAPYLQRVEASASTEWSEWTVEPKHWGVHMPGHCPAVAPPRRMRAATSRLCCVIFIVNAGATVSSRAEMPTPGG
jgi:hypothetical protein